MTKKSLMFKRFSVCVFLLFAKCAESSNSSLKPVQPDSAEQKSVSDEWSEEQGRISWPEAMLKCTSLKMRLPTVKEMDKTFKSGSAKSWKYGLYWTSEEKPKDPNRAFAYYFDFGNADTTKKSDVIDVRCHKQ